MNPTQSSEFSMLFQEHYLFILRYLLSVLPDKSIAEDVTQETFCEALRQYEKLHNIENRRGWLVKTAWYKMKEMERRLHRRDVVLVDMELADTGIRDRSYEIKELEMLLQQTLSREERMCFMRHYFWGYSVKELADWEGITENAMRVKLCRIKKKVNSKL
ncbi:MAG: sigma-70 family RNA polymerase sigma factor [Roseburia sp.]|nr:sigma-70 family RNA polymerase sigma factor [Roseburia sp.]